MDKICLYIVEDEPLIRDTLAACLQDAGYHVIGSSGSAETARREIERQPPDLALIDIELAGENDGIWLAKAVGETVPVVFITSHADAETLDRVKAVNPQGFIVKPFNEAQVRSSVELALSRDESPTLRSTPLQGKRETETLFVKQDDGWVNVPVNDILYLEADDNYTRIFLTSKRLLVRSTLKKLLDHLDHTPVIRCHRTYAIHAKRIDTLNPTWLSIGSRTIPVGRSYQKQLREQLLMV